MQNMKVTFNGEVHEFVPPRLGDLVAFERTFGVKASALEPKPVVDDNGDAVMIQDPKTGELTQQMAADVALEWVAFLVWRSFRRSGVISKDTPFDDDFLDSIEDFEMGDAEEADAEDPSVPAPQPG